MASPDSTFCNVCETQSNTNTAVKWCFECEEALCTECLKYHSSSKFTRSHAPIDIENYRSLPPYVLEIKQYCDEHGERFQNYCISHDCPCCSKCIGSSHQKCNPLPSLDDVVHNAKTSAALTDIEERLENLKCIFGELLTEKENNILDLKSEKESILAQIKQIRHNFNQYLDNLEKDIIGRLSEIESTNSNRMEKICTDLKKNESNAIELLDSLAKMKTFASDLQNFLGRRQLEDEVIKEEKKTEEVFTDDTQNTHHIVFQENTKLANLHSNLSSLGELSVVTRPSNIRIKMQKAGQAQINTTTTNNFDNLNLVIRQSIDFRKPFVFGCVLLENGNAVFADTQGKCLWVTNVDNDFSINLPTEPYDITRIDDKTLAVTSRAGKYVIYIVNLDTRKIEKQIEVQRCSGICLSNEKLLYSTEKCGLMVLDLGNYSISELKIGNSVVDEYVATRNNKIYCTNPMTSSVKCYNSQLSVAWEFKNSVLKGPRGIAVDDHFNVYIGGQESGNIVVISPDGQTYKEFDLQIKRPRTLYFEDTSKQILICGERGPAGIFSITM